MNKLIKPHLEQVMRRQRRLRLWRRLAIAWGVTALIGFAIVLLQRESGWSSSLAMPFVAMLAIAAGGFAVVGKRESDLDWRTLAREIEARYPDLDGRLLTAIEQHPDASGQLNYLQERVVLEAALHSQRSKWSDAIPGSRLAGAQSVHWLAAACLFAALWQLRTTGGHALLANRFETGIQVTPGDVTIERGNTLVVLARFTGPLPPTVDVVVGTSKGSARRISLAKTLADPVFGGSIPEVASNLTYHVEFAGHRTRDFNVTTFEHPRLEQADADLVYPEYTGQASKHVENTRRVTAVEGSRLTLTLHLNKPVTSAKLVSKGAETVSLTTETNRPLAMLPQFPLAASRTYQLQLVDADGRTNKAPVQFVFAVLSNRPPELRLASPRGDVRPSPIEEVSFQGTVWDDFGVQAYGLGYQLVGQETKFVELGRDVKGSEKRAFNYLLRLEDLGVQPDELVSWFLWADDVGPDGKTRRTTGDLYFAEVRPFVEIFREGQGQGEGEGQQGQGQSGGGQNPTERLTELQKQIISATWKLQHSQTGGQQSAPAGNRKSSTQNRPAASPAGGTAHIDLRPVLRFAAQLDSGSAAPRSAGADRAQPAPDGAGAISTNSDIEVVRDSQAQALDQARESMSRQRDPRASAIWADAAKEMERALTNLSNTNNPGSLTNALAAEQAAYQALLRAEQHEYQVVRSRNQQRGNQSGRQQQMQRQLDQLDLAQSESRYETQREAQQPQTSERREQLQVQNRLQELARRQQDLNDRLRELQTALQQAQTDEERAEIQRRLKRLQEEEQQALADVDELRQRMDRPENQSRMTDQRQQLDQTRNDLQRASDAAGQGAASEALAAGTRAQRQLQDIREQIRKENSSQFADDMRDMRNQARDLSRRQEQIQNQIESEANSDHKTLSDAGARQSMLDALAQQQQQLTNLLDRAARISQEAEAPEPLLSKELYDTVRKFSQDSTKNIKDTQDQLEQQRLLTQNLYDRLNDKSEQDASKLLDVTSEMLRLDYLSQAGETGQRVRSGMDQLKTGVERAAESVIGDDGEALRLAQQELDQLASQLQQELPGAGRSQTNQALASAGRPGAQNEQDSTGARSSESNRGASQRQNSDQQGTAAGQGQRPDNQAAADGNRQPGETGTEQMAQGQGQQQGQTGNQQGTQPGNQRGDQTGNQRGAQAANQQGAQGGNQQDGQAGTQQGGQAENQQVTDAAGNRGGARDGQANNAQNGARGGRNAGGDVNRLAGNGGADAGGGYLYGGAGWDLNRVVDQTAAPLVGPITGDDFINWSDRLRNVEEMIDDPNLRNQIAAARERARLMRQAFKRDRTKPDWAVVRTQVMQPLTEVRDQISDELARRGSKEALVPIDRDPVPGRYSELVRRYYEELGKDK